MTFEPRGKVAMLVDAMRAQPEKAVWGADEVAKIMDVARGNLQAYLRAVIAHALVFHKVANGQSWYSLQPLDGPTLTSPQAKLLIPTIKKPGDWQPPVMTPPRGATGYVPRAPLPQPLHQVIAAAPPATSEPPPELEVQADPADEEPIEPPEFNAALWADGDLFLYGIEEMEDGSFKVPAASVPVLKRLLTGAPINPQETINGI